MTPNDLIWSTISMLSNDGDDEIVHGRDAAIRSVKCVKIAMSVLLP